MDERAERRVRELMEQLDSLLDGESAAARLVGCGGVAVEPLRRFVFDSPPRSVPEPRCWAVRALAGLGEKDLLIKYLQREIPATDPVVRLAEETVQRTAALALAAGWQTDEVFEVLLRISLRHPIPGVIEAIGRFERRRAVPVLIGALGDHFCRPWAETALARVARRDRDLLIPAALSRTMNNAQETAPSLCRRRALVALLRQVHLSASEANRLAPLIEDPDRELAVDASAIAIEQGRDADIQRARRRLQQIAPAAPWHLDHDVQQLLRASAVDRRQAPQHHEPG